MKTYKKFINEGIVKDFLNKAFKSALKIINQDDAGEAKNFIDSMNRSNNVNDSLNVFRKYMDTRMNAMKKSQNIKNIKDNLKTDLIITDMALRDLAKKYDMDALMPNKLYAESNNKMLKDLFSSETQEEFTKNVNMKMDSLMLNLAKTAGLDEKQQKSLTKEEGSENIGESKLYEAEGEQTEQQDQNNESFDKMKQTTYDFISKGMYEPLYKKLQEVTKDMATGTNQNVDKIVDQMKGSNNKESMKSIINKIVNADNDTLMKMRDFVGLNKDNTPL